VPRAVLSAFMTGVCRTVVMNLENRGIGKPDLQTSANFVKGWTHQQPLESKVHRPRPSLVGGGG
jgi:hypothetical protein